MAPTIGLVGLQSPLWHAWQLKVALLENAYNVWATRDFGDAATRAADLVIVEIQASQRQWHRPAAEFVDLNAVHQTVYASLERPGTLQFGYGTKENRRKLVDLVGRVLSSRAASPFRVERST